MGVKDTMEKEVFDEYGFGERAEESGKWLKLERSGRGGHGRR